MSDARTATLDATSATFRRLTNEALRRVEALGQTDEERAERIGVSRRTYYRLQDGKHDIRLSIAGGVAEALGLSIDATFRK